MVSHFITRLVFRASLFTLVAVYAGFAVDIKLSNGATFSGEFVSQNENFITIVKNGSNLKIAKTMIATITGLPQGVTVTLPQAPSAAVETPPPAPSPEPQPSGTGEAKVLAVAPGMEVEITMQNNSKFIGTVIASDDRLINLQMGNGSRVNIYKHVISQIKSRTTGKLIALSEAKPATPPPEPTFSVTPSSQPPVVPAPVAPPATTVAPHAQQPAASARLVDTAKPTPSVSAPAPQQSMKPAQNVIASPQPAPPVAGPVPVAPSSQPPAPVASGPVPPLRSDAPQVRTVQPSPVPVQKPVAPVKKKRADGKSELLLKNGTLLVGVIVTENDRFLSFSTSDGTTITVIKRLIKEIDGVPYVMTAGQAAASQDSVTRLQRPSSAPAIQKEPSPAVVMESAITVFPRVELKQDITLQQIVDSLSSPSAETRSIASRQLGGMGQWAASSIPRLVALLADTARQQEALPLELDSITVQKPLAPGYEAARSLSRIGTGGIEELRKNARAPSVLVRQRAVFGLACLGGSAMLPLLTEALKDPEAGVRVCAVWGLRMDGATDALLGALKDRDGDVRTYAAASFADRADPRGAQAMIDALKDMRPQVRRFAIRALGRIRSREAVPALAGALTDATPEVRNEAAIALGAIADTAAVNALCAATRDNTLSVRRNALLALGAIRDPRAIPTLYTAIQETTDSLRSVVEQVLRLHTDIPLLIAALDDEKGLVRENAAYILWLLTGKDIGQDKKAWSDWYAKEGSAAGKATVKEPQQKQADTEKGKKK
jgi:HEAT repeat protein/sRNA-binding regulator protein Hfq